MWFSLHYKAFISCLKEGSLWWFLLEFIVRPKLLELTYVAQARLVLAPFATQPHECWDYRFVPPHQATFQLFYLMLQILYWNISDRQVVYAGALISIQTVNFFVFSSLSSMVSAASYRSDPVFQDWITCILFWIFPKSFQNKQGCL